MVQWVEKQKADSNDWISDVSEQDLIAWEYAALEGHVHIALELLKIQAPFIDQDRLWEKVQELYEQNKALALEALEFILPHPPARPGEILPARPPAPLVERAIQAAIQKDDPDFFERVRRLNYSRVITHPSLLTILRDQRLSILRYLWNQPDPQLGWKDLWYTREDGRPLSPAAVILLLCCKDVPMNYLVRYHLYPHYPDPPMF